MSIANPVLFSARVRMLAGQLTGGPAWFMWVLRVFSGMRRGTGGVACLHGVRCLVWVGHRHVTHWLVMGLLLHAYGIAAIWSSATQLFLLSRIYLFDAPVLVLQRRLAQLRRFRFYSALLLGPSWWGLWLLATAVGMQWLTGADLYAGGASPTWFWMTLGVGVMGSARCQSLPLTGGWWCCGATVAWGSRVPWRYGDQEYSRRATISLTIC